VCSSFASYPDTMAMEMIEVRGWVLSHGEPRNVYGAWVDDNNEDELPFDLLLDVGWTPTPGITAINDAATVTQWLTPYNIVAFGEKAPVFNPPVGADPANALPPGTGMDDAPSSKWSELGHKSKWGGTASAVVHVEVDGWGADRGCSWLGTGATPQYGYYGDSTNPTSLSCYSGATGYFSYESFTPFGWTFTTASGHTTWFPIHWPFPIAVSDSNGMHSYIQNGDYVRVVGTLWRDGYHGPSNLLYPPSGYGDMGDAKSCWQGDDDYTNNSGHLEIHPVEFVEKRSPPPLETVHVLAAYQICDKWGDLVQLTDSFRMPSRPYADSVLHVDEYLRGDFTNYTSLRPTSAEQRVYIDPTGLVSIFVQAEDANPPAKFMALYDAYWTRGCAAGTTLCGVQCTTPSSDPRNCAVCGRVCPPVGGAVPTCVAGACGYACRSGYHDCGGSCVLNGTICP